MSNEALDHRHGLLPREPFYGEPPVDIGPLDLSDQWYEFLHYLYLLVRLPTHEAKTVEDTGFVFPRRLAFLEGVVYDAVNNARVVHRHLDDPYVYVTAHRGYASPGNPLNRPGWHTDDFGGKDLNYVWTDQFPTRFLLSESPLRISDDDHLSMLDMARYAARAGANGGIYVDGMERDQHLGLRLVDGPLNALQRLSPHVIHAAPEIPGPGGMRSFFKISVSTHRYGLLGNSRNYDLDYDWPLVDRQMVRNQPQGSDRDYSGH